MIKSRLTPAHSNALKALLNQPFTLVEFVVRQQLQAQEQPQLAGLYAGNPKRTTSNPTTEQLLRVFNGVTLYFLNDGTAEISPLNLLQGNHSLPPPSK
jgi:hypothetical protein